MHQTGTFTGRDTTPIFTQRWLPEAPPRAGVLLAHGVGEHSGRYAHVAARFNAAGIAVFALDHRGHGRSGGGAFHLLRIEDCAADFTTYYRQVRAEYPDLPLFAYGHSMGSQIALLFTFDHQDDLIGLVLSGVALRLPAANPITTAAMKLLAGPLKGLPALPPRTLVNGTSRDPGVVAAYKADRLNQHGWLRLGTLAEIARAAQQCEARLPELRLPLLAVHGSADALTQPVGSELLRQRTGSADVTVTIYPDLFHEVHNEPEQAEVLEDISGWLVAHLPH